MSVTPVPFAFIDARTTLDWHEACWGLKMGYIDLDCLNFLTLREKDDIARTAGRSMNLDMTSFFRFMPCEECEGFDGM